MLNIMKILNIIKIITLEYESFIVYIVVVIYVYNHMYTQFIIHMYAFETMVMQLCMQIQFSINN